MMYNNIYQLTERPVDYKERMRSTDIEDSDFIGSIAAHVDDTDRKSALYELERWLTEARIGIMTGDKILFSQNLTERYFQSRFEAFRKAAQKLADLTVQQFARESADTEMHLWQLRQSYCDRFSDYVYDDDNELIPLDIFLRSVKPDTAYHIGGICKYHN